MLQQQKTRNILYSTPVAHGGKPDEEAQDGNDGQNGADDQKEWKNCLHPLYNNNDFTEHVAQNPAIINDTFSYEPMGLSHLTG